VEGVQVLAEGDVVVKCRVYAKLTFARIRALADRMAGTGF